MGTPAYFADRVDLDHSPLLLCKKVFVYTMEDALNAPANNIRSAPTFLGIGPPKCATTWLDAVLREHPDVLLPADQKEVFYFDRFHERGDTWYSGLFNGNESYSASGEISTSYIHSDETLQRVRDYNPKMKIIVLLRNPVNRMISNYRMFVENGRTGASFEDALLEQPIIVEYSRYGELLERVSKFFPRDQVYVGIYEEIFSGQEEMLTFLEDLLGFLGVDATNCESYLPAKAVRSTKGAPRSRWLVKKAKRIRSRLKKMNLEWFVTILNKLGIKRELFLKEAQPPSIEQDLRQRLLADFERDIVAVEKYLKRPVPSWR